jgi:hypothetical protein
MNYHDYPLQPRAETHKVERAIAWLSLLQPLAKKEEKKKNKGKEQPFVLEAVKPPTREDPGYLSARPESEFHLVHALLHCSDRSSIMKYTLRTNTNDEPQYHKEVDVFESSSGRHSSPHPFSPLTTVN